MVTPSGHAASCGWHLDQYPWECTCGLLTDADVMLAACADARTAPFLEPPRVLFAATPGAADPEHVRKFFGLPVVVDPKLGPDEWRLEAAPYQRDVLRALLDPDVVEIKPHAQFKRRPVPDDPRVPARVGTGRCEYCDGTGDVHRIDGEWLGQCPCGITPAPA